MFGMVLAIGLLVDDGLAAGRHNLDAVLRGGRDGQTRGLRRARKSLDRLADRTDNYIHTNLDTNSLEPRDLAALLKAQADLASTRAKIADREDRRRTGLLERQKLRAELAGELIQKHEVAAVAKVVLLPSLDDDLDAGSGVAPEPGPADALSRDPS